MSKNIYGLRKFLFKLQVEINVLFHYLPDVLRGKIKFRKYILFLKRILNFFNKLQHNKFVKIDRETRIDLYIPGVGSRAFFTACDKFLVMDKKMPCTTVLISVTSKCSYNCKHCYQKLDKGKDVDINKLIGVVRKLQDKGIAFFNIEGGEPFIEYDRLLNVCKNIDKRSEIWVNSTGYGISKDRLIELRNNNVKAIMFSYHTSDVKKYNEFMGFKNAYEAMEKAIALCHETGVAVAFNSCMMKEDFTNGNFELIMEKVREYGAAIIQIIKPKPSGAWLGNNELEFSEEDIEKAKNKINMYNQNKEYRKFPSISAQIIEESKEVFGCTAGGTDRFYINAKGDLQPCEFLNISFGNITKDDFDTIYERMRKIFETPGDCMICEKYSKKIEQIYKDNNLKTLPLTPELSKKVYKNWERGENTQLYL